MKKTKQQTRPKNNPWSNLNRAIQIQIASSNFLQITPISVSRRAFEDIREFYGDFYFSSCGDMWVELVPTEENPEDIILGFTDEEKQTAIKAQENPIPTDYGNESAATTFINTFTRRVGASQAEIKRIRRVAAIIARLDGHKKIELQHLAEAMHYSKEFLTLEAEYFNLAEPDHFFIGDCRFPVEFLNEREFLAELIDKFKKSDL